MPGIGPGITRISADGSWRSGVLRRRHVREDRLDLGLQRRRIERLDDVVVHTGLLGCDHVLGLGFRRDHDEGRGGQIGVGTDFLEQVVAGHRLHVPVGNHEPVFLAAHLVQRRKKYGLVISDWNMEPMTGYDLLKEVRADPNLATTPFIMITAESKTENVIAAKKAGVNNYIVKPFNAATLKTKIEAVFPDMASA